MREGRLERDADAVIADIVAGARTLTERLAERDVTAAAETADAPVEARLVRWCATAARGDWALFGHRLSWDGYDLEVARGALRRDRLAAWTANVPCDGPPLPAWAALVQNVVAGAIAPATTSDVGAPATERFVDLEEPVPFEEVLTPFVVVAHRRLAASLTSTDDPLTPEAHAALERDLLHSLVDVAADVLYLEFSIARAREQSAFDRLILQDHSTDARTLYRDFVGGLLGGGLLALFGDYPALARMLGTRTLQWIETTSELRQLLADDAADLQRLFGDGRALGRLVDLRASLSDRHRGGRSVAVLTFEGGQRIVYKPKDLGTEEAYNRLLAWLNDHGAPLPFRVLRTLNRSTHGWAEFVAHEPCRTPEEARRYFRRAGALTALLDVLVATDCHYENIVACGEHPLLIDMETLLHHRPVIDDQEGNMHAQALAAERLMDSVLRSGLLPRWSVSSDRRVMYDISGLGSVVEQEVGVRARHWDGVNTDRMRLEYRSKRLTPGSNVAMLDGRPLLLQDHADDLIAGFEEMHRFLMRIRDGLLTPDGPLHQLGRQQVRYVHRDTSMYRMIERSLLTPSSCATARTAASPLKH